MLKKYDIMDERFDDRKVFGGGVAENYIRVGNYCDVGEILAVANVTGRDITAHPEDREDVLSQMHFTDNERQATNQFASDTSRSQCSTGM